MSSLVGTSHSCTMSSVSQSPCPLASILPSGLNATLLAGLPSPVRVAMSSLVEISHNCTMPSVPQFPCPPVLASVFPSGLNATLLTGWLLLLRVTTSFLVGTSHSCILRSRIPAASMVPSGLNATALTPCVAPMRVPLRRPVSGSHSRIATSCSWLLLELPGQPPAVASVVPSGLNAALKIELVWPVMVVLSCPVSVFHSRILPSSVSSSPTVAMVLLSGRNAMVRILFACPPKMALRRPVSMSHTRTMPSGQPPPLANVLPSELNAILLTAEVYSLRMILGCHVTVSRNHTVLSQLALANVVPSGLNATLLI